MAVELNSNVCFCKDGTTYKTRSIPSKNDITADHYLCFRKNDTTYYVPLMLTETSCTTATPLKVRVGGTTYSVMKITPSVSIEYSYTPAWGAFMPGSLSIKVTIDSAFTTDLPYTIKYTDDSSATDNLAEGTLAAGGLTFSGSRTGIWESMDITNVEIKLGPWRYNFEPSSSSYTITTKFN